MNETVYQFVIYDINSDQEQKSRRMGTLAAIAEVGGKAIMDTGVVVDESAMDPAISGLTVRNFSPNTRGGFQTEVI